jgi:hypothetical protein
MPHFARVGALILVLSACSHGSPPPAQEPSVAGIQIRDEQAPPAVRQAAFEAFGPSARLTYIQLTPYTYAVQGQDGDRVREIRMTAGGQPLEREDDDDDDDHKHHGGGGHHDDDDDDDDDDD